MWDWDFEDWQKFSAEQQKKLEEWRNIGKSKEQIQREKEELERRERMKHQPPQVYEPPIGFIIYLIVMAVGAVFVDRWLIWIAATLIYFGRKR